MLLGTDYLYENPNYEEIVTPDATFFHFIVCTAYVIYPQVTESLCLS